MEKLCDLLGIRPGITALIGGGGKTTLMYHLARELHVIKSAEAADDSPGVFFSHCN